MNLLISKCDEPLTSYLRSPQATDVSALKSKKSHCFSRAAVLDMLSYLNPDMDYGSWFRVVSALHDGGFDEDFIDNWCKKGNKYNLNDGYKLFEVLAKRDGSLSKTVTMGTLVHMAKKAGWSPKDLYTQSKSGGGFSFVKAIDLINHTSNTEWLIDGYFSDHSLSMLFGDPGSGKSFLALDFACCICSGKPWMGRKVKKGAVFYLAGEGHNGLGKRLKAWEVHNGVPIGDLPLYISERPAQIYDFNSAEEVIQAIDDLSEHHNVAPVLIVIDTLARNCGSADENNTKDMNVFINHVDQIKNVWNASVLIVHHTGHSDKKRCRGAMALKASLDFEYRLDRIKKGCLRLVNTKMKDGEAPDSRHLSFESVSLLNAENTSSAVLVEPSFKFGDVTDQLSPKEVQVLKFITELSQRSGKGDSFCIQALDLKAALEESDIFKGQKKDSVRRGIQRVLTSLSNQGVIKICDDVVSIKTDD